MMMGGSGMIEGLAKTILLIGILVAVLSGIAGVAASNNLTELPIVQAEAALMQANIDRQRDEWTMQQPYYEEKLAAENAVLVAQAEQERQLIEANTAAEIARIEAATASYQAGLADQRQMALTEHQQALIEANRWNQVVTITAIVIVFVLAIILVRVALLIASRIPARQVSAVPYDPWRDPAFRRQRINELRKLDEERNAELIRKVSQPVYSNGSPHPRHIRPSVN